MENAEIQIRVQQELQKLLLLKVAQKLLLWMEECMAACDFNQDDIDLYHELRQTIRTAGGFSSEDYLKTARYGESDFDKGMRLLQQALGLKKRKP